MPSFNGITYDQKLIYCHQSYLNYKRHVTYRSTLWINRNKKLLQILDYLGAMKFNHKTDINIIKEISIDLDVLLISNFN